MEYDEKLRKRGQLVAYAFSVSGDDNTENNGEHKYDFFIAKVTLFRKSDRALWLRFIEDRVECIRVSVRVHGVMMRLL